MKIEEYWLLLRHDLPAFIHRTFLELNPQTPYLTTGISI